MILTVRIFRDVLLCLDKCLKQAAYHFVFTQPHMEFSFESLSDLVFSSDLILDRVGFKNFRFTFTRKVDIIQVNEHFLPFS